MSLQVLSKAPKIYILMLSEFLSVKCVFNVGNSHASNKAEFLKHWRIFL